MNVDALVVAQAAERQRAREALRQEAEWRWQQLEQEHPEQAGTVAFGRGLVRRYIDELPAAGNVTFTPRQARAKLKKGIPLLEDQDLDLDLDGIRRFFFRLCPWAGEQDEFRADSRRLEKAVLDGSLAVEDLIEASLAGDEAALRARAEQLGVSLILLQSLTGFTVSAALMETARTLAPLLEKVGGDWHEGICPLCGGPPLLAEGPPGAPERTLRCAACGGGWRYPANRCVHCGNDDPSTLDRIADQQDNARYAVELCDRCHGYLKVVTTDTLAPAELLTIEDAALLHLDALARERGYQPALDPDAGQGATTIATSSATSSAPEPAARARATDQRTD